MSIALAYHSILHQADELEALIDGCSRNERGAQSKLYHLFYRKMYVMVRRYYSDEEAVQEILNNGFLRAFKKIDKYSFKGSFEGWLRVIVRHAVTDYSVKNMKYDKNVQLDDRDEFVYKGFSDKLYYDDLVALIDDLPGQLRMTFNLFAIEGMSHREIAKALDIKEGTSKWYVSEARKKLKVKIEELELHLKK